MVSHRESLIVGEKDKESLRRQAGVSHYRAGLALGDGELGEEGADRLGG